MASDDLRARIDAAIRPNMLFGLQDAELHDEPGRERINEWADWISRRVAELVQSDLDREAELSQLLMEQRQQMAAERYVWQERGDRYRAAWMGARNRAQGLAQRYRYERKLCDSADLRATKAIRKQLAVEAERDAALAALQAVREAQSLGEALAAVAKHDGLTAPELP